VKKTDGTAKLTLWIGLINGKKIVKSPGALKIGWKIFPGGLKREYTKTGETSHVALHYAGEIRLISGIKRGGVGEESQVHCRDSAARRECVGLIRRRLRNLSVSNRDHFGDGRGMPRIGTFGEKGEGQE